MAENNDNTLIGYDPLAWMDEEFDETAGDNAASDDSQIGLTEEESQAIVDDNDDSQHPVHLESTLSIQNITGLHEILKKVLTANDTIELYAGEVTSIDTASLQLLVALKKEANKLQKTLVIDSPSPRFKESAKFLGLTEILDV